MTYVITARCAFWHQDHTFRTSDLYAWFDKAFDLVPTIQIINVTEAAA